MRKLNGLVFDIDVEIVKQVGGNQAGAYDFAGTKMQIRDMQPDRQGETILHELIHHACRLVYMDGDAWENEEEDEEELVETLSRLVWPVLRANPGLLGPDLLSAVDILGIKWSVVLTEAPSPADEEVVFRLDPLENEMRICKGAALGCQLISLWVMVCQAVLLAAQWRERAYKGIFIPVFVWLYALLRANPNIWLVCQ